MYPTPVLANKILEQQLMTLFSDHLNVPDRMIENDEYAGELAQHIEQDIQTLD